MMIPGDKRTMSYMAVADLIPYVGNSRTHSEAQVKQIAASMREFGFTNPVLIDEQLNVIAGHGRILAAELIDLDEVPCIIISGLTQAQKKALVIADNQLALNAEWDMGKLSLELEALPEMDFDTDILGFDEDFMANLLSEPENEGLTDEDAVPEAPEDPVTVLGDLWALGNHKLLCGDSTSTDAVERLMDGEKAVLIHADPPYGMGKENDGVLNDNLYQDKLDAFQMSWWLTARPFIDDNGSAYIWGNAEDLWRLWYSAGLRESERLTFRNEIVWNKSHGMGVSSDQHRSYPVVTERCLFFMVGEQGFNNNVDNYWDGFESIRAYLDEQRKIMGWTNDSIAELLGFNLNSRNPTHWFTKSQWSFIREEHYTRLQQEAKNDAFKKDYDELKKDYDTLKKEFYGTRAYFDNVHENMTDVFTMQRVVGEDRHGHATPKPVELIKTLIKSSAPSSGLVFEPFGGSGSTLIACEGTGRSCNTMELSPVYIDVIIKRWQEYTGNQAVHENGQTFDEISESMD